MVLSLFSKPLPCKTIFDQTLRLYNESAVNEQLSMFVLQSLTHTNFIIKTVLMKCWPNQVSFGVGPIPLRGFKSEHIKS